MFAVGIGKDVNTSLVDDIASEPKKKHSFVFKSFENVTATSVTQKILKAVEETPVKTSVSSAFFSFTEYYLLFAFLHYLELFGYRSKSEGYANDFS